MREVRVHILLAAVFASLVALGALQGSTLKHLRESERFYRWLAGMAEDVYISGRSEAAGAAPETSSIESDTGDSGAAVIDADAPRDYELLANVIAATQERLGGAPDANAAESRIMQILGEGDPDNEVWELASSEALSEQRAAFKTYLRARQLEFARDVDIAEAQSSGVNLFNLFFGFRKIAANFVWLQVDKYWHMGMTHRMLPLMKTTVMLDPHFVDAYLVGAWHLAYNITAGMGDTKPEDKVWLPDRKVLAGEKEKYYYMAADYYDDGIRNNPREYKLYFESGFCVYKNKLADYPNAVWYLTRATRLPHERWVPRQLYICQELNGQYEDALRGWQDYLKRFPENIVAPRFIKRNQGLIKEAEGDRLMAQARATEDPAAAQALRARAMQEYEHAKQIYSEMKEAFADGRIVRIDSVRLAEEGRYLEAIALLEHARWESAAFWDEASRMIMDYKQRAGVPLSQSEKKAMLREEDEAARLRAIRAREIEAETGDAGQE